MKKHILVGTSLLLTLGTAVAGTLMYGNELERDDRFVRAGHQRRAGTAVAGDDRDVEGDRELVRLPRTESADLNRHATCDRALYARLRDRFWSARARSCRQLPTTLRTVR